MSSYSAEDMQEVSHGVEDGLGRGHPQTCLGSEAGMCPHDSGRVEHLGQTSVLKLRFEVPTLQADHKGKGI